MSNSLAITKNNDSSMNNRNSNMTTSTDQKRKYSFIVTLGKGLLFLLISIIRMLWSMSLPIIDKLLGIILVGTGAGAYLFHHAGNDKAFYITLSVCIFSLVLKALTHSAKR